MLFDSVASIFCFPDSRSADLLSTESSRAEYFSAARELFLLWLVGLAIPCVDDLQHHGGVPDRPEDRSRTWRHEPREVVHFFAAFEFLHSWHVQIFQFLRRFFLCDAGHAGRSQYSDAIDPRPASPRDFVLHLSGSGLHR